MRHVASLADQPYDEFAADFARAAAMHEDWKEEERRRQRERMTALYKMLSATNGIPKASQM